VWAVAMLQQSVVMAYACNAHDVEGAVRELQALGRFACIPCDWVRLLRHLTGGCRVYPLRILGEYLATGSVAPEPVLSLAFVDHEVDGALFCDKRHLVSISVPSPLQMIPEEVFGPGASVMVLSTTLAIILWRRI
jgi:hypothetical protein